VAIAHWLTFELEWRHGDTLRASRDAMGRRRASLVRADHGGRIVPFWTFDNAFAHDLPRA
jgi:hypothetical protein